MRFKDILLWIWQLPQNLVALIMLLVLRGETRHRLGSIRFYFLKTFPGGITLGEYIIVGTRQELTVRHEFGHVLQSRYLGPLLNGVIGCCDRHPEGYFHFWTERWANRLAGLNTEDS